MKLGAEVRLNKNCLKILVGSTIIVQKIKQENKTPRKPFKFNPISHEF